MNELFSIEFVQTIKESLAVIIETLFVILLSIIIFVYSKKYFKMEDWNKTQSSLYAKAIIEIARLKDLLSEEAISCLNQSIHIKLLKDELKTAELSTKRKGLRKEIARLKGLNNGLETTISNVNSQRMKLIDIFNKKENEYKDRIQRLTETIEKRKHQPKQTEVEPETGWWRPIDDHYKKFFPKEGVFMESVYKVSGGRFMYLKADDSGRAFLVEKKYFRPVIAEG